MVGESQYPDSLVTECDQWFSQGDIFAGVPLGALPEDESWPHLPSEALILRAALLVTHGCALDKKSRSGELRIERMHFLPLENVTAQSADKQSALRRGAREINPSEVLYLGDVPGLPWEAFVVLSSIHTVPARVFEPILVDVVDDDGHVSEHRLSGQRHSDRVARISDQHVELLLDKLNAYWTRRVRSE